ncbi:hypothetical protein [Flavobacterium sp.]|uniref:hypothetical protein n=1 Tax=Flavobacterium sp. TaxID=239 RepID=UPI0037518BEF
MKLYYLFVFIIFSANTFAQEGSSIPSTGIPRVDMIIPKNQNTAPQYSISKPFEITKFKKPSKIYDAPQLEKPNKFNSPVSDLNPGKMLADRMNKSAKAKGGEENSDSKLYRRDMFLGDFKTKAEVVGIFYRDFGLVDGDLIRISVNDKIVIYEIYLGEDFKQLDLKLEKGINKIDFEALNQGYSGPNTAEFKIFDEKSTLISENQWNLGTGFKATVIVVKE